MSENATHGRPREGEPWTVLGMILWSAGYLEEKGVPNARLDAEHLLAHAVGVERLQLYLDFDRPLSPGELDAYRPMLKRRASREPLQYILGHQPFRGLDLEVGPGVLIPRPETEYLVDRVLEDAGRMGRTDMRGLDIGTGSGAIALSLAFEGPFASVVATDLDEEALAVAKRNRERVSMMESVEFRAGPLFEPLESGELFDVIVSNPPYVADGDAESLEPEVSEWEPHRALFAGEDGLEVLQAIVHGAHQHLSEQGLLGLEVGAGQAGAVAELLQETGRYASVSVYRDYGGKERVVLAQRA